MNKYDLNNKVAFVTGASRGIGKQIAKDLIISGARVALISRGEKELNIVSQEFSKLGENIPLAIDIKNIEEVKMATKTIIDKWGKIDILVNNAGVTSDNLLIRMKESEWDHVIDINLKGIKELIQISSKKKNPLH